MNDYLNHSGIINMHWGVKNGPPYPLSRTVHAKVVAGKIKDKVTTAAKNLTTVKEPVAEKKTSRKTDDYRTVRAKDVLKNLDQYSDEDLKKIANRLGTIAELEKYATADKKSTVGYKVVSYMESELVKPIASIAINTTLRDAMDKALNESDLKPMAKNIANEIKKSSNKKLENQSNNQNENKPQKPPKAEKGKKKHK